MKVHNIDYTKSHGLHKKMTLLMVLKCIAQIDCEIEKTKKVKYFY